MAAPLLTAPPDDGLMWIPPGALGPQFTYLYTLGRNDGAYLARKRRTAVHIEISHTMGGPGTETPQSFANGEMGSAATLAEIATFPAAAWTTGKAVLLQSLPLDIIGAGSVDGGATGITHESAELAGDPNAQPWTPDHLALKVALTAWLIRNPLGWPKLAIRYQVCKSPYGPTPALGGLGAHTMWDTCGVQAGGTNPWTLVCKSCPGWKRRGTTRKVMFPTGQITDIPFEPGNFRDYYQRVGAALTPIPPTQEDEDMTPAQDQMLRDLLAKVSALEPKVNALYGNFDPTSATPPDNIAYWMVWKLLNGDDSQRPASKADLAAAGAALRDLLANLPPVKVEVPELVATLTGPVKVVEPS